MIQIRFILCLVLALVFIPLHADARDKFLDIQEITSPGGIKAWLVEDHSIPVIAVKFSFLGAGARNDPADKQGLARLASNTMDEGAGDLDSQTFQKELRDQSISISFNSGRDHFGGTLKTLSKNKTRAYELLTLALTKPRFDKDAVDRMRKANQSRIRSSMTDPNWMAARLLNDKAFAGHSYAHNSGGTLSTLDAITTDDLRRFAQNNLSKDKLIVSIAGDMSAEDAGAFLDAVFGALPAKTETVTVKDIQVQNSGKSFIFKREDIPQTFIEIMQNGVKRDNPDYHHVQIMNFVLGSSGFGSRLTEEIREKRGLTYGIYSSLTNMDHFNGLSVSTSTAHDNVEKMLKLINDEFAKMRSYPISEEELKDAKSYLIGALPLSLTSTDKIAGLMQSLQADGLGIDYLDKRQNAIESATLDDIFKASQKLLKPESFLTILVGNPKNTENMQVIEKLPNVE